MTKYFGVTAAVSHVNMKIYGGEIRGLIGENGSGKSTISSIIAGIQKQTEGEMLLKEKPYHPKNMIDALEKGIGMVVQEKGAISEISIAENIFLGKLDMFKKYGIVNRKKLNTEAQKVLQDIGLNDINAADMTSSLDQQDQKLLEVAKVMMTDPDIFIVDETTTALSQRGRALIYELMRKQKKEGKSVLFISHDLEELIEVCDTLTVLRDGNLIRHLKKDEIEEGLIKQLMVGREMTESYYRADFDGSYSDEIVLKAEQLYYKDKVKGLSLELHKGEILGIGGLSHCGMHELGKCLFGFYTPSEGEVLHIASDETINSTRTAMKHKLGYVSKDRDHEALVLAASVKDNIAIAGLNKIAKKNIFVTRKAEKAYVTKQIDKLQIKCSSMNQNVQYLSGGNKQKVVFGKWIGCDSQILILDCPTRGVDIGVKSAMYDLMEEMKKQGKSIIMISEELTELIGMSDRIVIMKDGKTSGSFTRNESLTGAQIIGHMI